MRRFATLFLFVLCLLPVFARAQGTGTKLTVEGIVSMVQAGVSDEIVISKIQKAGQAFDLSPEQIIELKKSKVSDAVIKALLDPLPPAAPPIDAGRSTASPLAPSPGIEKLELGMYGRKDGIWHALTPEIVSVKQQSGIRMYTGGVDTNGFISGQSSKVTLKTPIEVMIVAPEGVSATEYQLIRLKTSQKQNTREFKIGRFGFGGSKAGVERARIPFEFKKVGAGQFTLELPSDVTAGEYAFLPPPAAGGGTYGGPLPTGGKAFTFRVLE